MIPDDDSDDDESYAPSEDEDDKIKVTCVVKSQTPEGHSACLEVIPIAVQCTDHAELLLYRTKQGQQASIATPSCELWSMTMLHNHIGR